MREGVEESEKGDGRGNVNFRWGHSRRARILFRKENENHDC